MAVTSSRSPFYGSVRLLEVSVKKESSVCALMAFKNCLADGGWIPESSSIIQKIPESFGK